MLQPCEETTLADIQNCKALIADLEAFSIKAEQIALRCGARLNGDADLADCKAREILNDLRDTLNELEREDTPSEDRRAAVELRHIEARVA
jgi:hypothetical protein